SKEVSQEELNQAADIGNQLLWTKEELPAAKPIASSRWPAQPHGVAISDAECGEYSSASVRNQSSVKMPEAIAPDVDKRDQRSGNRQAPEHRVSDIAVGARFTAVEVLVASGIHGLRCEYKGRFARSTRNGEPCYQKTKQREC